MANIALYLDAIKNAVFGKDVRNSIYNAINELYHEPIPPASTTTLGGIKPISKRVNGTLVNYSGLKISSDGTTYVDTKAERGIIRDGEGQIQINPATQAEVIAESERYKPVTPATLGAWNGANRASLEEVRYGGEDSKYVTPHTLKNSVGYLIEPSLINGDFTFENVPCASINQDIKSIHGNPVRDAGLRDYTSTPQQIGAWIDGTPVWRVAFNTPLSAQDLEDKAFWTISALGLVNDLDAVTLILGGTAALYMESIVDNQTTSLDANGAFTWSNSVNPDANAIAGYIEFVTPASNIRS